MKIRENFIFIVFILLVFISFSSFVYALCARPPVTVTTTTISTYIIKDPTSGVELGRFTSDKPLTPERSWEKTRELGVRGTIEEWVNIETEYVEHGLTSIGPSSMTRIMNPSSSSSGGSGGGGGSIWTDPCVSVSCGSNTYCSEGSCYCNSGYSNCDGSWTNGCEVNTNTDVNNCGSCDNVCSSDNTCSAGSCVKALSVFISPKTVSVYANEEVTFTVTVKNELTTSHEITINSPEYYNNTGNMMRMSSWDTSTASYTRIGMDMMDESDSFSASESKTYTLRVRTPGVNATTKIVVKVSVTGTRAEDSAEMNVNVDYPRWDSFTYSGTLDYFNTFWNVTYPSGSTRNVAIKCVLNCPTTPNSLAEIDSCVNSNQGQKCIPYPYTQPPGTGSCSVPNPQYRFLTPNEIKCVAYDPTNTAIQTMSE